MNSRLEESLASILKKKGLTASTAESCTGGLVSDRITNVPGSSSYFPGGIVAYSNQVKIDLLGVLSTTIEEHGAVSRETATEMATGVRRIMNTDLAVSITGIAGPGGGTIAKPVGTTWIGVSSGAGSNAVMFQWEGDRHKNKTASADTALAMLIEAAQQLPG